MVKKDLFFVVICYIILVINAGAKLLMKWYINPEVVKLSYWLFNLKSKKIKCVICTIEVFFYFCMHIYSIA